MKVKNALLLLLAAVIWGTAFVAQSVGMDANGPFTFLFARSVLGGVVLLPVALLTARGEAPEVKTPQHRKWLLQGGLCCGLILCTASGLQQVAIQYAPVGKVGFLTTCYILMVPIIGLLLGRRCSRKIWLAVAIALVGMYLLCMAGGLSLALGDILGLLCAVVFAGHILCVDHFVVRVNGVQLSCVQFFVVAVVSGILMLVFEQPSFAAICSAWLPICYAGIMSSGVAYTLQIVGQKGMNPTVASLIMSLESVISVIAGWLILGQALTGRELIGCALMFVAVLLAQLPDQKPA